MLSKVTLKTVNYDKLLLLSPGFAHGLSVFAYGCDGIESGYSFLVDVSYLKEWQTDMQTDINAGHSDLVKCKEHLDSLLEQIGDERFVLFAMEDDFPEIKRG